MKLFSWQTVDLCPYFVAFLKKIAKKCCNINYFSYICRKIVSKNREKDEN